MQPQKLCLKWNNHTANLLSVLGGFQQRDILVDVTISCEGQNIKAHKMVLSACSPYFQNIFLENPCQHPIVIINGMKYEDITAILNFMYKGEVNVSQDGLTSFLQAAEALKVKGLAEVCGEKRSTNSNSQDVPQNEQQTQNRPQRTDTPPRKRHRNRKRSLSDSNRSDDEGSSRKQHREPSSPEVHELSGDESYTGDTNSNGPPFNSTPRVPQNVYSRSHQSSSNMAEDDDEFEVEPSKLLEQTLTTDNVSMNNSSADKQLRIERIMGSAELESSSLQEPESPPDIKPIIDYGDSSGAGPSEGSMMLYNEQSQPGPSSLQDGSLLHDNAHQDKSAYGPDILSMINEDLKELGLKVENRSKLLSLIGIENSTNAVIPSTSPVPDSILPSVEETEVSPPKKQHLTRKSSVKKNDLALCTLDEPSISPAMILKYSKPETIPVLEAVRTSIRGRTILKTLDKGEIITQNDVREILRLVLAVATKDLQTLYPSFEQKIIIAKAIVMAIPQLRNTRQNCEGYEQFFDPQSRAGMIEWRLKTMRLALDPSKKKYRSRKSIIKDDEKEDVEDVDEDDDMDEDIKEKIIWLKYEVPSQDHRKEIFMSMSDTFKVRRKYILRDTPTVTEILKMYPKLMAFQGELIESEFFMMYPDAGSFVGTFPSHYTKRIIKYCKEMRPNVYERYGDILNEDLSASLMLADLLPRSGIRRKRDSESIQERRAWRYPSECIIRFLEEGADVEAEAKKKIFGPQPFLFCQGNRSTNNLKFFLTLDGAFADVGSCPIKAVDFLYKSHYVFNVKYNRACECFFLYLDFIIYNMKKGPSTCSIENLNTLLNRVNL